MLPVLKKMILMENERLQAWGYRLSGLFLFGLFYIGEQILMVVNVLASQDHALQWLVSIIDVACLYGAWWLYQKIMQKTQQSTYNTQFVSWFTWRNIGMIVLGTIILMLWQFGYGAILLHFHWLQNTNQQNVKIALKQPFFALMVVIIAPILEELAFRGIFISCICYQHQQLGVLISSLAFACVHCLNAFRWYNLLLYLVAGFILGEVYVLSKDIRCDMLVHIMNNLVSFLL